MQTTRPYKALFYLSPVITSVKHLYLPILTYVATSIGLTIMPATSTMVVGISIQNGGGAVVRAQTKRLFTTYVTLAVYLSREKTNLFLRPNKP